MTAAPPRVADPVFSLDAGTTTAVIDDQWTPLTRLAVLLLGDRAAAEDAVQDACEATPRLSSPVRDREHLVAYLRTAVVNRCRPPGAAAVPARRFLASARPVDAPAADAPVLAEETDRALLAGLARLAPRQRAAAASGCRGAGWCPCAGAAARTSQTTSSPPSRPAPAQTRNTPRRPEA